MECSYWHPVLLHVVPGLKLVELPLTVTMLLFVVRGDNQSTLLPKLAHADHVDVTVKPHPLDRLMPELQRFPETAMLSMKVLSDAVAAQLAGIGEPLPHELAGWEGFWDSATEGLDATTLPFTSTTRICI
jgi:hypothetical protein